MALTMVSITQGALQQLLGRRRGRHLRAMPASASHLMSFQLAIIWVLFLPLVNALGGGQVLSTIF